jgi:hypothetical protein
MQNILIHNVDSLSDSVNKFSDEFITSELVILFDGKRFKIIKNRYGPTGRIPEVHPGVFFSGYNATAQRIDTHE